MPNFLQLHCVNIRLTDYEISNINNYWKRCTCFISIAKQKT